ncbi:MAG TPA: helix-turn-helix domain-containing protein, partial [Polyangiaceae bacterium]
AARELFVHRGFVTTSMEAIAGRAKVAAPTVYAAFGSKRAILTAIAEQLSADTLRATGVASPAEVAKLDVREQVRVLARFRRLHGEIGGDILQMVQGTALVDPDAAALVAKREAGRRERARAFVVAWKRQGALRPGLTVGKATDVLWALGDAGLYRLFVMKSGWSGDRFERWIRETMEAQLLR